MYLDMSDPPIPLYILINQISTFALKAVLDLNFELYAYDKTYGNIIIIFFLFICIIINTKSWITLFNAYYADNSTQRMVNKIINKHIVNKS